MGITFFLTPHIIRISLARSWYFSTFSPSFALTLPSIATSKIWQFFAFLSMINRSGLLASLNVMVCSYSKIPQHLVILILFSWQVPMDCSSYVVVSLLIFFYFVPVLDTLLQYGWWSRCFVCTFCIWDRSVSCRLLLLHDLFLLLDLVLQH